VLLYDPHAPKAQLKGVKKGGARAKVSSLNALQPRHGTPVAVGCWHAAVMHESRLDRGATVNPLIVPWCWEGSPKS
jgi:hypothetical protein